MSTTGSDENFLRCKIISLIKQINSLWILC